MSENINEVMDDVEVIDNNDLEVVDENYVWTDDDGYDDRYQLSNMEKIAGGIGLAVFGVGCALAGAAVQKAKNEREKKIASNSVWKAELEKGNITQEEYDQKAFKIRRTFKEWVADTKAASVEKVAEAKANFEAKKAKK